MIRVIKLLLFFSFLFSCTEPYSYQKSNENDFKYHSVYYYVKGTAQKVQVKFRDENGNVVNKVGVYLPWFYEFKQPVKDGFQYLIGVSNMLDRGDISVEVDVDGRIVKKAHVFGAYCNVILRGKL